MNCSKQEKESNVTVDGPIFNIYQQFLLEVCIFVLHVHGFSTPRQSSFISTCGDIRTEVKVLPGRASLHRAQLGRRGGTEAVAPVGTAQAQGIPSRYYAPSVTVGEVAEGADTARRSGPGRQWGRRCDQFCGTRRGTDRFAGTTAAVVELTGRTAVPGRDTTAAPAVIPAARGHLGNSTSFSISLNLNLIDLHTLYVN